MQIIAIIKFQKRMMNIFILNNVIYKFNYLQKSSLVVLSLIYKYLKIGFYYTIFFYY